MHGEHRSEYGLLLLPAAAGPGGFLGGRADSLCSWPSTDLYYIAIEIWGLLEC
jgi:hypothetical protein